MQIEIANERLILHPESAIYWDSQKVLLVADLHLGKIDHFRNAGLYVPRMATLDNYERLSSLLLEFDVQRMIVLGDLFHSTINRDWQNFSQLRQIFKSVAFDLVMGNHDIIDPALFATNDIACHDILNLGPFSFSHFEKDTPGFYNLSGHIHPGVRLKGIPGHSVRVPCFFFGEEHGILPAFGTFTGTSMIKPKAGDQVIVISDGELISMPNKARF